MMRSCWLWNCNHWSQWAFISQKCLGWFDENDEAEKALEELVNEICNKTYIKKCRTDLFRLLHFNNSKISSHLTILPCLLEAYNLHLRCFQKGNTEVLRAKITPFCFCIWPCSKSNLGQRLRVSSGKKPHLHKCKQNWTDCYLWFLQESQPIIGLMRRALVSDYKVASSLQASIKTLSD